MNKKNKNIVLIIVFFIILVLCYNLAISNTLNLKKSYESLKQEEISFKNTPKQLSLLKQKQKYYDSLLNKYHIHGNSIQNNLLKGLNTFSKKHDLKVIEFKQPHSFKNDDLTIKTYSFTIEGNYNNLLNLIYTLEQRTKFGEIINLHFERKKNFRLGKNYLQMRVLLKSFS
ncbi:hypothetical protein [uncultured Algibacter sp.]|uniref:hypothetical protein n=1 Tax=uncultured Algibacter sp. TaxID=298659 RepID=UPI002615A30F|nr:hypothetical protein [uncultured Algibacter sp.]